MKSHTSLAFLKIASDAKPSKAAYSSKSNLEVFTESLMEHHSKIDAPSSQDDTVRYLHPDTIVLRKLKKMVSLYESIETDLQNKGIDTSVFATITQQEENIISLIAEGLQTKEIASKLFISEHTVQTHRKNIYKKLNVTSVTDLVKISMMFTFQ